LRILISATGGQYLAGKKTTKEELWERSMYTESPMSSMKPH
jgi:hypothetical protein